MNKKELDYLLHIATLELNASHYKVLLLLLEKPYNQAALAEKLKTKRQSVHKCIKELVEYKLIEIDREEGRNKFYKAVTDVERLTQMIPGQTQIDL